MATSLKDITALQQFPQTEKLFKSIPATPKGYLGPAETGAADVELMQARDIARENVGKAEIGIERAKREEKTAELASQADLEKEFAERRKNMPELGALKEGREKLRGMEFVPTKDTVQDIAGLFSLIGVIGMAVGGGGRMASQQAMGAMNGMMEGYRKGRSDLFKKQQIEFDKNFKAMQTAVNSLRDDYAEALEIEKTDKEAGRIARAMALNKAGSPVLKAMEDRQGSVSVMNTINDLYSAKQKMVDQFNSVKAKTDAEANAERRHRENIAAANERARLQREVAATKATASKGEKPPAKEIIIRNELRNTLIPKLESAIPIIDRLNQEGKWNKLTSLLAIDPRAAEAQFKNDEEALSLIRTLAYFRSKEFETAGKALTRKEDQILAPIVRSDLRVYEATRGALLDGLKTMQQEQIGLEAMYPYIKTYNQTLRGESADGGAALDIDAEREAAYEAIQAGADINAVKARFRQKTGQGLGADEE
jgi:hypothetical protein